MGFLIPELPITWFFLLFRPLAVNLGLRYARSKRSFISFVSLAALAGLALSVATLVFVLAVVAGFEREMNERVLGIVPHIVVRARLAGHFDGADFGDTLAVIRGTPGVMAASAVVDGAGLLATDERVAGVSLVGVDPHDYGAVSRVFEFVRGDSLEAGGFGVLIGAAVAQRLGIGQGDTVTLVLPQATMTPLGAFARQKRLRVAGIIDSGSHLDRSSAYLHRADAAKLFRFSDGTQAYHLATARALDAGPVASAIADVVGLHRFRVSTWFRTLGNLHRAIGTTRSMLFLLLSLLVAVAAFNLVSSLVMVVNERRGDIAMLRTMGTGADTPMGAFAVLGMAIAVVGVGIGVGAGMALGALAEAGFPRLEEMLGMALMSEYLIAQLPVQFQFGDVAGVAATALALCLLATLWPAWRAARLNPADVLQHE